MVKTLKRKKETRKSIISSRNKCCMCTL